MDTPGGFSQVGNQKEYKKIVIIPFVYLEKIILFGFMVMCNISIKDFLLGWSKKTGPWNGHSSMIFPSLKSDGISKDGTNIICTS